MESLLTAFRALPPAPTHSSTVDQLVLRLENEQRLLPPRLLLSRSEGAVGDRWGLGSRKLEAQVTLMRADIARMLIGDGRGIEQFGDNLFVTIDTSTQNLPPGTRLRIGNALLEVTPKPHRGCLKFAARSKPFSRDLLDLPEHQTLQLRGVHLWVVEEGEVAVGDAVVRETSLG